MWGNWYLIPVGEGDGLGVGLIVGEFVGESKNNNSQSSV